MFSVKSLLFLLIFFSAEAFSGEKILTGTFVGDGRACYGKLSIRKKTIEWHAAFTGCKSTSYEVYKNDLDKEKPEVVFSLKE